ncbi:hypothetical protein [Desulfofalx alkaliphila]|uniref:hypothetical protein n=1 Tax=Desulfofalx alkaliphila TaxID=105483 RepID=UPI0004E0C65E|nr:hypothetical protein [Desulfofalx alkaliphila]
MQDILNATDVRKEWGRFIDTVVREKPKVVKRNRDYFIALSINHIQTILKGYRIEAQYLEENDGSITATLINFDIVVNAPNQELACKALAEELKEYAQEYFNDFNLYYHSPNRQPHFPYVMAILVQDDLEGVINLIA